MALRFKTKPFAHQLAVLEGGPLKLKNPERVIQLPRSMDLPYYGLFHEPGLGKSKSAIDYATHLYTEKAIDGVVILAPSGVHLNWELDEIPTHMPEDVVAPQGVFCWRTDKSSTKQFRNAAEAFLASKLPFKVLILSYDSLMTDAGALFAWRFLKKYRCLMVADESHFIKTPGAKRTIRTLAAAKYARFRRALTGTLVDSCPFDVYPQLKFVDDTCWDALGCRNAAAFRAMFGVFERKTAHRGGRRQEYDELVDYRNLDILNRVVAQYGSRLLKEDVLDLPPKLYEKRYFELTPNARRAYNELMTDFLTLHGGGLLTAPLAVTRMIRLQQVTSGYLPTDAEKEVVQSLDERNPRIELLLEVAEELAGRPAIIWCKYNEDVRLILEALKAKGFDAVRYDGTISDDEKLEAKTRFQKKGDVPFFVSKTSVGGTGLTLTRAQAEIFYNTTFGLGKRRQAEDRAHRIGQEKALTIYDLVARNTIDGYILKNLRENRETANVVMGDPPSAWI